MCSLTIIYKRLAPAEDAQTSSASMSKKVDDGAMMHAWAALNVAGSDSDDE